jgi:hypothetical protein
VGDEVVKSSVVHRNRNPSWREKFVVELKKGSIQEGLPVNVVFEVRACSLPWWNSMRVHDGLDGSTRADF